MTDKAPAVPSNRQLPVLRSSRTGQEVPLEAGKRVSTQVPLSEVDLLVVFDTTGSMAGKIDGLIKCLQGLVDQLGELKLDWRFSVVPFGDRKIGEMEVTNLPFTSDVAAAKRMLADMPRFYGGGNTGESSLEAVDAGLKKDFRRNAVKVLVVLTDEPAHQGKLTYASINRALTLAECICFVASADSRGYKQWADDHGGEWYRISSSMDMTAITAFLSKMLAEVASVSRAVHILSGGSVKNFLALEPGKRKGLR